MNEYFDLHMHSTCSDGSFAPKELLEEAKSLGLRGISITDHDTIEAYDDDLFAFAREKELILVPGVEFSTEYEGVSVHVLAYFFMRNNPDILELCRLHQERRKKRNAEMLHKLNAVGYLFSLEELYAQGKGTIGRPHIAKLLQERGVVNSTKEAFERFIGDGKSCFVRGEMFGLEETLEVIHKAGGKAVLAHPHLLRKKSFLRELLTRPFDGLECYYARFSEKQNQEMVTMALRYDLIPTGGSDFHGDKVKPQNAMGSAYTTLENVRKLGVDQRDIIL